MKRKLVSIIAIVLCIAMSLSILSGCVDPKLKGRYTYNTYTSNPNTWNIHAYETSVDSEVMAFTEMGFYDAILDKDTNSYKFVLEMARGEYQDVTASWLGQYGIPQDAKTGDGYAIKVQLRNDLKWSTGEEIKAADFAKSLELLLSPKYKNLRAENVTSGSDEIYGAKSYASSGTPVLHDVLDDNAELLFPEESVNYFSMSLPNWFFGSNGPTPYYNHSAYKDFFFRGTEDLYKKWHDQENMFGLIEITAANRAEVVADLKHIVTQFGYPDEYYGFAFNWDGSLYEGDFNDVGIKVDTADNSFILFFTKTHSDFEVKSFLTWNWLVQNDLYVELSEDVSNGQGLLFATKYGTSPESYPSYGPYMVTSFQRDKVIELERNPNWYGWSDGKHADQFQTTHINMAIITEQNTRVMEFLAGNLDSVGLTTTEYETYKFSEYLLRTDSTQTWGFYFNTDAAKLAEVEANSGGAASNLQYFANLNFRKALSWAIDRSTLTRDLTVGSKAALGLVNDRFYYDFENDAASNYRRTQEAKEALLRHYEVSYTSSNINEKFEEISPYSIEKAKEYFQKAYDEVGAITGEIKFRAYIYTSQISASRLAIENFINECLTTTTAGTSLAGKVKFAWVASPNGACYDDFKSGNIECLYGSQSGNYLKVSEYFKQYTVNFDRETGKANNWLLVGYGWDPDVEELTVDLSKFSSEIPASVAHTNGKVTMTFADWFYALDKGGVFEKASKDLRLAVIAEIEFGVLQAYTFTLLDSVASASLYSKKINFGTMDYLELVGRGGIRFITYNYDDFEWTKNCQKKGFLNYE